MDEVAQTLGKRLDRFSNAPLIVAFSGGGDSLALLLAVKLWANDASRRVIAITIDHRLQEASASWARECAERSACLEIEHRILAWTGEKPRGGIAAAARAARHRLLAEAAREAAATVILLGHTLDDLMEARWMRAEGGSVGNPREWVPSPVWPQGRGLFLLRPLLGLRRETIRDHLRHIGETWIEDPANTDPDSRRVQARLALVPFSHREKEGPAAARRWEDEGLRCVTVGAAGDATLDLARISPTARRRVVGAALLSVGGGDRPPRGRRLDALLDRLALGGELTATLAGTRLQLGGATARLTREAGATPRPLPTDRPIVWDGRFEIAASAPDLKVRQLAGVAASLDKSARRELRGIPAAARGALPAVLDDAGRVTCPLLQSTPAITLRCLVADRLAAAVGAIATEAQADAWRRGAGHTKSVRSLEADRP